MTRLTIKPGPAQAGNRESPLRLLLLLACLFTLGIIPARAQETFSEADVKAAFILQTARFVEWPAGTFANEHAPIRVAVFAGEEFSDRVATSLRGQRANSRPFVVKRITTPQEAAAAEIVFIGEAESRRTAQVLDAIKNSPVLTVGETGQFFEQGGMIHVFLEQNRLRFEINLAPAEAAGLTISSKLLTLARRVAREGAK